MFPKCVALVQLMFASFLPRVIWSKNVQPNFSGFFWMYREESNESCKKNGIEFLWFGLIDYSRSKPPSSSPLKAPSNILMRNICFQRHFGILRGALLLVRKQGSLVQIFDLSFGSKAVKVPHWSFEFSVLGQKRRKNQTS